MGYAMPQLYPVSLNLAGKQAVVIGGGSVAERKMMGLLPCDARVTVVSPQVTKHIYELSQHGEIRWREKRYEEGDLTDAEIVFVATDDPDVNEKASQDAQRLNLPVNVADCPPLCTFYLPSVMRRGRLTIAISTEGAAPLLARKIRESFDQGFPDEFGAYVELLAEHRGRVIESIPAESRTTFWEWALNGEIYRLVCEGKLGEADKRLNSWIDELAE